MTNLSRLQVPDLDSPVEGSRGHDVPGGRAELDDGNLVAVSSEAGRWLVHLEKQLSKTNMKYITSLQWSVYSKGRKKITPPPRGIPSDFIWVK